MKDKSKKILALEEANAAVLVEIITGANISENLRISAMEKLMGDREGGETFFQTMLEEKLTYGVCPHCDHKNHWMIPEEALNMMGWVSHKEDERVPETTDSSNCELFQQACLKKKITT